MSNNIKRFLDYDGVTELVSNIKNYVESELSHYIRNASDQGGIKLNVANKGDIANSYIAISDGQVDIVAEVESNSDNTNGGSIRLCDGTVVLSAWDFSVGAEDNFDSSLIINRNGLAFNGSQVITNQNKYENGILTADLNNNLNRQELSIGNFEIKNVAPYNYTLSAEYTAYDWGGEDISKCKIVAEWDKNDPVSAYLYIYVDDTDVVVPAYKFIVDFAHVQYNETDTDEWVDYPELIGKEILIPAGYLDENYSIDSFGITPINFTDGVSESINTMYICNSDDTLYHIVITQTAPFALRHTSKALLNGSPVMTADTLASSDIVSNINNSIDEKLSKYEPIGVTGDSIIEHTGNGIRLYTGGDEYSEVIVTPDGIQLISCDGDINNTELTINGTGVKKNGKEIATEEYVDQMVVGGIRFGGIETELPWEGELSEAQYERYLVEDRKDYKHGDIIIVAPQTVDQDGDLLLDPSSEYILVAYEKNLVSGETEKRYHWELLGETTVVDKRITDEITRATDEEAKLNTAITTEFNRAVDKENELLGKINANTTAISNKADKSDVVIGKDEPDNSAVLKGEYKVGTTTYSNKALSKVSVSLGAGSTAGLKGWYYSDITFGANPVITLSDSQPYVFANALRGGSWKSDTPAPNINAGDKISIVNDSKYDFCGEVKSISGNKITLKEALPFDSLATSFISSNDPDDWTIYLPERANAGIIDMGAGAFAEGINTQATNIGAHAEGIQTHAYGQYSHTEGFQTEAGYAAHAEGKETIASGSRSHAEGQSTVASGDMSHAQGNSTKAIGKYSHAEGYLSSAEANASHAEGYSTKTLGDSSHAEGWKSTAHGKRSHAEGSETYAEGNYSHTEGLGTKTTNEAEHASGKYNKSTKGSTIFSVGNGTDDTDRKNAFEITSDGNAYIGETVEDNKVVTLKDIKGGVHFIGTTSQLPWEGLQNTTIGQSLAGSSTQEYNVGDIIIVASGGNEHGFDEPTKEYILTYGNVSEENGDVINGYRWVELGDVTPAQDMINASTLLVKGAGIGSVIVKDRGCIADGQYSTVFGRNGRAYGNYSYVEGRGQGNPSSVTKENAETTWDTAETSDGTGDNLHLGVGDYSHVEGFNNIAVGNCTHVEGQRNKAKGVSSHAEGWKTQAIGNRSHAEGQSTKADGSESHAGGIGSIATGSRSFAHGNYVNTTNNDEVAFGKYNVSNENTIFSIGNGTSENSRSNILEIKNTSGENDVNYQAPKTDIYFSMDMMGHSAINDTTFLGITFVSSNGIFARYRITYINESNYKTPGTGDVRYIRCFNSTEQLILSVGDFIYVPLEKPSWEDEYNTDGSSEDIIIGYEKNRCMYINTFFTKSNAIYITDDNYNPGLVQLIEYTPSSLFVNGARVLIEDGEYINNTKFEILAESKAYIDNKLNDIQVGEINSDLNLRGNNIINAGRIYSRAFYETSDERIKIFTKPIETDLDKLSELRKSYFTYIEAPGTTQIGVSAQEVQKLYPEIVSENSNGLLTVDYSKLSVIALNAVDELNKKNKDLEARLERLEKMLLN